MANVNHVVGNQVRIEKNQDADQHHHNVKDIKDQINNETNRNQEAGQEVVYILTFYPYSYIKINKMTNEEKARIFDGMLLEFDKMQRELGLLKSNIFPTKEDEKKIKELEKKMNEIQVRAARMGVM
jgi:hypothetical protein